MLRPSFVKHSWPNQALISKELLCVCLFTLFYSYIPKTWENFNLILRGNLWNRFSVCLSYFLDTEQREDPDGEAAFQLTPR